MLATAGELKLPTPWPSSGWWCRIQYLSEGASCEDGDCYTKPINTRCEFSLSYVRSIRYPVLSMAPSSFDGAATNACSTFG